MTLKNQIKNDYEIKIFQFKDQLLFFIDSVWYQHNPLIEKLEKHQLFNTHFSNVSEVIPINDKNFLVLKDKLLYIIHPNNGKFVWELIPLKYYEGKIINHNTKVFQNGNTLYVNLDDGFFTFHIQNEKIKTQNVLIEAFYQGQKLKENSQIDYNQSIELNIISEFFGYNRSSLFYKLNQKGDYLPILKGELILNNLTSGQQLIEVYSNDGLQFQKVASYEFLVDSPWYFSLGMLFVYFFLIFILFYLYYKWNKIQYTEKLKRKEEELKHQKEILQIELEAENKLRLQEYEKHILEMQVQTKASEVAGKSLSIAKQSEMIESIQRILETESDLSQLKSKINKSIKINAINKKEWESFEKNIYQSHEEFVNKLTKKYPQLTSKDIKLSIYLKMNLSSKEIAPLMNISYRGVELHRYRLRKKLNLNADDNLTTFMINL
jgi:DNA-binding CsgD family transcriptional regulator